MLTQAISQLPVVNGYHFRFFKDESDYAALCEAHNICNIADGLEEQLSVEEFKYEIEHQPNFHLADDLLIVEHDDAVCGYMMVYYRHDDEGNWIHWLRFLVLPELRLPEVEEALLAWGEDRLRQKCAAPGDAKLFFQTWCGENMTKKKRAAR